MNEYKCIECGHKLRDFSIKPQFDDPEIQEREEVVQELFYRTNAMRRFYCYFCDIGFEEDEIIEG